MSALKFRGTQAQALEYLDDSQWTRLLAFTDVMHLTLTLALRCARHLPNWVQARIAENLRDNQEHLQRLKVAYEEIKAALDEAQVEHLVLKGFSHWLDDAESVEYRMQSDIDLYCPRESLFRARDALARIGFITTHLSQYLPSDQHLPKMFRRSTWQWRGNYFDPEIPVSVDLHGRFWNADAARFGPAGLDQFWERRMSSDFEGAGFLTLRPIDGLAYSSLHLLRHAISRNLLTHNVYEIAHFLHHSASDAGFWAEWQQVHHPSLRRLEAIAFRFACDWFDCDLSPEAQNEIEVIPTTVQRWFHYYSDAPLYALFHPNKQTLWLHLALVESQRDRRSVLLHGLVPSGVPPLAAFDAVPDEGTQPAFLRRISAYLHYVYSRARYHGSVLPATIWQSVRWWYLKDS